MQIPWWIVNHRTVLEIETEVHLNTVIFKSRSARLQIGFQGQINAILKYMHF